MNVTCYFRFCTAFWLVLALVGSTSAAATQQPNILFILADDMGWQDTSVPFGPQRTKWNDRYRTPALERLARQGMKFTQAYACAVCSPTRVSLMTGQNEARHGVTQWTYLSGHKPSSDLEHPTLSHADWIWNGLEPAPMPEVKAAGQPVPWPIDVLKP